MARPDPADLARCVFYLERYEHQPRSDVRDLLRQTLLASCPRRVFPPLAMTSLWPFGVLQPRLPSDEQHVWGRYPEGDSIALQVAAQGSIPMPRWAPTGGSQERMPDLQALLARACTGRPCRCWAGTNRWGWSASARACTCWATAWGKSRCRPPPGRTDPGARLRERRHALPLVPPALDLPRVPATFHCATATGSASGAV